MNTNTPNQNTATTEPAPGKVVVVSVDDGDEQSPTSEAPATIEDAATSPKKRRAKPLTPAEREKCYQRQRERIERTRAAIRTIKKLAPQIWHEDWWLKPLDWLEAKAGELREAADAAKGKVKKAV